MADLARRNPKIQRRIQDVQAVEGLKDHVGFKHLRRRMEEFKETFQENLAKVLWTNPKAYDEDKVWHNRGFYEGAMFVLDFPEKAAQGLEEAAVAAYRKAKEEPVSEEEDKSPYA